MKSLLFKIVICFLLKRSCSTCEVDLEKTIVWGPGLNPSKITLPVRYFFVQFVDTTGQNLTEKPVGNIDLHIGNWDKTKPCRVWSQILDRNDGSFIVRYKIYDVCSGIKIDVRYENHPIHNFPLIIENPVLPDDCNCPKILSKWKHDIKCPQDFRQINDDLSKFTSVDMDKLRSKIIDKFNKKGSMSICHYVILNNEVHRTCYGQYVGFHVFMDAMLLSIARKVKLPNLEFFVNLGDWPLEKDGPNPLPIFSWCGSDSTADIVMPTYDISESTLEAMGRVQLDMLSVQGKSGPIWPLKKEQAFWRGRDSRKERLDLIDISRKHPSLFNASLTNFFFFRDKEKEYGPKVPHVSFFDFFEYKYQICIDGSVAAYRLPYLLAGGSLVLKQESPYFEHFYKDLQPGEHYIPIARDLTNLVDKIKWAQSNDDMARKIAQAGALFARDNLMPSNIFCYYVSLFEEWGKRLKNNIKVLPNMDFVSQAETPGKCDCGTFKVISDFSIFLQNSRIAFKKKFGMKFQNKGEFTFKNFVIRRTLGSGAFGTVYAVTNDVTGRSYAMKVMKKKAIVEKKQVRNAYLEKRVLQSLQFPFVVNLRFFFMDSTNLYYLMPLAIGGEMFHSLKSCKRFSNELCRFYGSQVLLGLEYLHYLNLIFRDLKPENVVIFHTGYLKITDFGFCKVVTGRTYSFCGTPEYMAPEILQNKGYGRSVDWWAYGVMLYEMAVGHTPFRAGNFKRIYKNILKCELKFPDGMSYSLRHLVQQLVQPDLTRRYGNLRAGVLDIKRHPWFQGYNWLAVLNQKIVPPYKPPMKALMDIGKPYDDKKVASVERQGKYSAIFNDF